MDTQFIKELAIDINRVSQNAYQQGYLQGKQDAYREITEDLKKIKI